ncbi:winged helix-turn-helix transcriptional regulator [Cupriavidus sp. CuC1]|uniref:winged helix-turn-helix transcriptional regulator n=1 Tax=Cupriavidus sp. CuC1 TaxID=3373131 RepID=UPI0037CEDB30
MPCLATVRAGILEESIRQSSDVAGRTCGRKDRRYLVSLLLLREAFYGATRFDEFQKRPGISPNMLVRRLAKLIDEGLLARRQYSALPRDEDVLTERGPILLTLMDRKADVAVAGRCRVGRIARRSWAFSPERRAAIGAGQPSMKDKGPRKSILPTSTPRWRKIA